MPPLGPGWPVSAERSRGRAAVNPLRTRKLPSDKAPYREPQLIECCISKLKQFRRVATRYEKTARNYLAVVTVASYSSLVFSGSVTA
jgi:transposase